MTLKEGEKDGVFGCGVLKVLEKYLTDRVMIQWPSGSVG